jgi:preprotein translocase subunit SecA
MIDETIDGYVNGATVGFPEEWNLDALWTALKTLYPVSIRLADLEEEAGGREGLDRELLTERLRADAHRAYDEREAKFGDEVMRELERRVLLSVLDRKWREHLYEMDYLREGIGLRAYSQRDPLVEYQREGFDMFNTMMDGIKEESVAFLFNLEVQVEEEPSAEEAEETEELARLFDTGGQAPALQSGGPAPAIHAKGLESRRPPADLTYTAPTETGDTEVRHEGGSVKTDDEFATVGRNDLCPCGSGKKYKKCHGAPGGPTGQTARVS